MPTIFPPSEVRGYRFMIHSDDHPPAHVHIYKDRKRAIYPLDGGPARACEGYTPQEYCYLERVLKERRDDLLKAWSQFHGN